MAVPDYDDDGALVAVHPVTCDRCGFLLNKLYLTLDVVLTEVGNFTEVEGIRVVGEAQCCGNQRELSKPTPQALGRVLNHLQTCRENRPSKPDTTTEQ